MNKLELKDSEYIALAARTEAAEKFTTPDRFLHGAIGIFTELVEFREAKTRENKIEEIGDLLWYIALIMRVGGQTSFHILVRTVDENVSVLSATAVIADAAKRWKYYSAEPDDKVWDNVYDALAIILSAINGYAMQLNVTTEMIMASNIYKLQQRYPQKFTEAAAVNRDTDKEIAAVLAAMQTTSAPAVAPQGAASNNTGTPGRPLVINVIKPTA